MLRLSFLTVVIGLLCCSLASAAEPEDVQALIQAVGGQDQAAALQAIDELADLGPQAEPAVAVLLEAFAGSDETVRSRAARTLGAIGEKAAAAVPALTAALADESAVVRAYAAFALGRIGKAAAPAAEALAENAFDKEALVRRASLNALRSIDPPREVTRPVFLKILKEGDASVIMPALQSFAEEASQDLPRLKEALQDEEICYWACIVAQDIGPAAAPAVPELSSLLDHKDPDIRMHAAIALAEIGEGAAPALPLLVAKLTDTEELVSVKFASAFALGRINQQDDAATRALVDAAKNGAPLLKVMSWWALARQNPDRSKVVEGAAVRIAEALTSDDPHLRKVAARALAEFDVPRDIVRPILLKTLQHADPEVIGNAMDALASLGPEALEDIDDVLSHPVARHFATLVIFRMGPKAAPAATDLIEALQAAGNTEDDNLFRREAQMALAAIGPDAAAAVPVLVQSLASDDREVRGSACYALGKIGPAAAEAVPALQARLNELEDSGKVAFVWALLSIQPDDEALAATAVPMLVGALDAPDEIVRAEAAGALGRIGEPAAQPDVIAELKKLLDDPAPQVQEAAAEALKELE
jgi:HEAT repeat protein